MITAEIKVMNTTRFREVSRMTAECISCLTLFARIIAFGARKVKMSHFLWACQGCFNLVVVFS